MSPIRVLQIFTIMNRGGAESMIMNYYRKINRDLIQFDFLVHRHEKGIFDEEIENLGGKIYRLDAINPFYPKKYYQNLRSFFNKHKEYNIIHSHLNTFSYFPTKIAEEFNIPCRITHAHIALEKPSLADFLSGPNGSKEFFKKIVKLNLRKRIGLYSTHQFSCGIKAGKWLYGPNSSFEVMNNAIDAEKFKYDSAIAAKYKIELSLQDNIVIGHIGRFSTQKNHIFLFDILCELLKLEPSIKLLLVGDGPLRKQLEAYADKIGVREHIIFLGVRTDIENLCMAMDYFAFPSLYEGLPVTLIEAQCSGLKIIASDEITREVKLTNNIYFESLESSAHIWAEKILSQIKYDREDRIKEIVENEYDIVANTVKLQNFYLNQNHLD